MHGHLLATSKEQQHRCDAVADSSLAALCNSSSLSKPEVVPVCLRIASCKLNTTFPTNSPGSACFSSMVCCHSHNWMETRRASAWSLTLRQYIYYIYAICIACSYATSICAMFHTGRDNETDSGLKTSTASAILGETPSGLQQTDKICYCYCHFTFFIMHSYNIRVPVFGTARNFSPLSSQQMTQSQCGMRLAAVKSEGL